MYQQHFASGLSVSADATIELDRRIAQRLNALLPQVQKLHRAAEEVGCGTMTHLCQGLSSRDNGQVSEHYAHRRECCQAHCQGDAHR
jgi:hypothetical protein